MGGEVKVPTPAPYLERARNHLDLAAQAISDPRRLNLDQVETKLKGLKTKDAGMFLVNLLNPNLSLIPVGRNSIRREGLIFSIINGPELGAATRDTESTIVKLFGGGFNNSQEVITKALYRLYPDTPQPEYVRNPILDYFKITMRKPGQKPTIVEKAGHKLQNDAPEVARYFASAEIMSRAVAHLLLPDLMPEPPVLLDPDHEPVGLL